MEASIKPLKLDEIPALSALLRSQFCPPGAYCGFAEESVLDWKFFQDRPTWPAARSWGGYDQGQLVAHIGFNPTNFQISGDRNSVQVGHISDWLNVKQGSGFGALLLLQMLKLAPAGYAFGSTPVATHVLLRSGFKLLFHVPLFHRVIRRTNIHTWREMHGAHKFPRGYALLAADALTSLKPLLKPSGLEARPVKTFGPEVSEIFERSNWRVTCSTRTPELLNYFLHFPLPWFHGFVLHDSKPRGFALVSVLEKPHLKVARIVECFLDSNDVHFCADALAALHQAILPLGADVVTSYGSTPWMAAALLKCGYFRRGKTQLLVRDPREVIPRSQPFHLTHLEADLSFI